MDASMFPSNRASGLAGDRMMGRLVIVSTPADEDQIDVPTMLWLATLPVVGPLFYALGRAARRGGLRGDRPLAGGL